MKTLSLDASPSHALWEGGPRTPGGGLLLSRAGAGAWRRQGALRVARGRSAAAARGSSEPADPVQPTTQAAEIALHPADGPASSLAFRQPSRSGPLWPTRLSPLCGPGTCRPPCHTGYFLRALVGPRGSLLGQSNNHLPDSLPAHEFAPLQMTPGRIEDP